MNAEVNRYAEMIKRPHDGRLIDGHLIDGHHRLDAIRRKMIKGEWRMGYYIPCPVDQGKAAWLAKRADADLLEECPRAWREWPDDKSLIVVVTNGTWEAAAVAFSEAEFRMFTDPEDKRPKQYLLMDRRLAEEASGMTRR